MIAPNTNLSMGLFVDVLRGVLAFREVLRLFHIQLKSRGGNESNIFSDIALPTRVLLSGNDSICTAKISSESRVLILVRVLVGRVFAVELYTWAN